MDRTAVAGPDVAFEDGTADRDRRTVGTVHVERPARAAARAGGVRQVVQEGAVLDGRARLQVAHGPAVAAAVAAEGHALDERVAALHVDRPAAHVGPGLGAGVVVEAAVGDGQRGLVAGPDGAAHVGGASVLHRDVADREGHLVVGQEQARGVAAVQRDQVAAVDRGRGRDGLLRGDGDRDRRRAAVEGHAAAARQGRVQGRLGAAGGRAGTDHAGRPSGLVRQARVAIQGRGARRVFMATQGPGSSVAPVRPGAPAVPGSGGSRQRAAQLKEVAVALAGQQRGRAAQEGVQRQQVRLVVLAGVALHEAGRGAAQRPGVQQDVRDALLLEPAAQAPLGQGAVHGQQAGRPLVDVVGDGVDPPQVPGAAFEQGQHAQAVEAPSAQPLSQPLGRGDLLDVRPRDVADGRPVGVAEVALPSLELGRDRRGAAGGQQDRTQAQGAAAARSSKAQAPARTTSARAGRRKRASWEVKNQARYRLPAVSSSRRTSGRRRDAASPTRSASRASGPTRKPKLPT